MFPLDNFPSDKFPLDKFLVDMFLGRQVPGWTSSRKDKLGLGGGGFSRKAPRFICIGYILPTFGEYIPVERFLCALRAQG